MAKRRVYCGDMKKKSHRKYAGAALVGALLTANVIFAQTVAKETTTTTTSVGTISEFSPETIIIKTETSPEPVRYMYTKTTTYVDEAGEPVSIKTVKSGLPVTVYYVKDGDSMVASKVIVRTKKHFDPAVPTFKKETTTKTTTSAGTISEFGPETIIVKSESSPEPMRYSYSKTTTYVDDAGAPVSMETVKSGLPVTVYYAQDGDRMVASKVIVRRTAVVAPATPVIEKKTTTTTTTDK
jgi:hypothetical protein